jgi:ubiquinone/menaquinone biosynthesis C-methylase UbiE
MSPSRYDFAAWSYDWTFRLLSLGLGPSLHRLVAAASCLDVGDTVVDLGCGTGLLLPHLVGRVGEQGTVIGVDSSPRMLERAVTRVTRAGWRNVELERGDMLTYTPPRAVDVVVFCLSLSTVPDPEAALRRAVGFTRPGGQVVILDALVARGRWYHRIVNAYTRLKAIVVGSKAGSGIDDAAARLLPEARISTVYGGLYTLVAGRPPTAVAPGGRVPGR